MRIIFLFFWFVSTIIQAPSKFDNFILRLERTADLAKINKLTEYYFSILNNNTFPIIEGNEAYFIYKGKVTSVGLIGDMQYWTDNIIELDNIVNTDIYYKKLIFESDARIEYLFKINGNSTIKDPNNPNTQSGAFGTNSVLKMPSYYSFIDNLDSNNIFKYTNIDTSIYTTSKKIKHDLTILIPNNYIKTNKYKSIYFNAGKDYLNFANAKLTIEKLTAYGLIEPIIAVFIEPNDFINDYTGNNRYNYSSFISNSVVPFIDSNFNTISNASNRLLIGDSYGGNITALTALKHNNVFNICALQSPDFSPNNYEVLRLFSGKTNKNLSFFIVGGSYETTIDSINSFVKNLRKSNIPNNYQVLPQGHSWGLWKQTLSDILIYFLSDKTKKTVFKNLIRLG